MKKHTCQSSSIFRNYFLKFILKSKIQNLSSASSSGFSTVELLVTLFIAAAFLVSGYQLYSVIIKDGGETRRQAKASNLAYDYLQQYKIKVKKNVCDYDYTGTDALPNDELVTATGLTDVKLTVEVTCVNPDEITSKSLSKIVVTVKYGNPQKQLVQATYVNKE